MDNELAVNFAEAPPDFPALPSVSSLAGVQPKLAVTLHQGKYYVPGDTPPERHARWLACEALAQTFVKKCLTNEHGKYNHLSREGILEQYCTRLLKTDLATAPELLWVIRRAAHLLSWPVPENARITRPG